MASGEGVAVEDSDPDPPRRRRGIGGMRWGGMSEIAATPSREWRQRLGGSVGGAAAAAVSARKLAASVWRLAAAFNGGGSVRWRCRLSFDRLGFEFCSSTAIPKSAEGVTKWDCCDSRAWGYFRHFESKVERSSAAYPERINELICASCMRMQHQNTHSAINKLSDDLERERKHSRKMDVLNLKLLRDVAETKLSARRALLNVQKEKKARVELQAECRNLAKEIEGTKTQLGALRNQRKRVEDERKMLQVAEVWREEQAQMKIADAKLAVKEEYAKMSNCVGDLKPRVRILEANVGREDGVLRPKSSSVLARDHRSMMFKFPKSDKEFAIVKDSQQSNENGLEKSEASKITSLTLMQPRKKGTSSSCKILKAWSRSKIDTSKTDGSSDRSVCSNVSTASPQRMPGERGPEVRRNPHVIRAMKGHIEWPRKIRRRGSGANLLEAKLASEKTMLRNVLKQRS